LIRSKMICGFIVAFLGSGGYAQAQSQVVPTPSAPTPVAPALFDLLSKNPRTQLFGDILRKSNLHRDDLDEGYLTFIVPRDGTCAGGGRSTLEGIGSTEVARSYVLEHAFRGQLAIYREDRKLVSVNYFPDASDMRGRVTIDEGHPYSLPLLSGHSILVSVRGQEIQMGSKATVVQNYGAKGGAVIELDQCAAY